MRRKEEALYEVAMDFREAGWPSEFDYEDGHDLFRFANGKFAFLNEYANGRRPRELGVMG